MSRLRAFILLVVIGLLLAGPLFALETDYLVGDGDVLKLTTYGHDDLTTVVRVSGGMIRFPLIGQVKVEGISARQVGDEIARLLADGYIINPQVSAFVEEFRSKKVTIVGEIGKPGLYELSGPTTLLELLSTAGGLTRDAGDRVIIHHQIRSAATDEMDGEQVNLRQLLEGGGATLDVPLRDGDSVFIAKAGMIYVTGEVKNPNSYKLEEGETFIMAVTKAGGFTRLADKGRVKILRKIDGVEQILEKFPVSLKMHPDDVVVVPESFF